MVRRRLTLKRIDPWSMLKFGFVANLSLLAIWLLGAGVVWFFIQRLQLISKVCEIATEVGFVECGVNGGNLFRAVLLLGLLGVIIQTGLAVFLAFLYNLIADLVGGLTFSFVDDTPGAAARGESADSSRRATAAVPAATQKPRDRAPDRGPDRAPDRGPDADRTMASPAARPEPRDRDTGTSGTGSSGTGTRPTGTSGSDDPTTRTSSPSDTSSMWSNRSSNDPTARPAGTSPDRSKDADRDGR